jgi:transitional endoplasmic reticulum ATPase
VTEKNEETGEVVWNRTFADRMDFYGVKVRRCRYYRAQTKGSQGVNRALPVFLGADLRWEDFDHVAADRDQIELIFRQATARPMKGIHILLYGSAGTGKTEFCKMVAARVGVPIYSVGETDNSSDEPCRCERLGSYRVSQRLLGSRGGTILLFDEMEDLLDLGLPGHHGPFPAAEVGSRVFIHRLLEDSAVPTLWTINDIERVRPAILRRMTYALEMKVPDSKVRARVWRRVLEREKVAASDEEVLALAQQFEAPPALAASAVRSAALTGGGVAEMQRAVTAISKALQGGIPPRPPQEARIPLDLALFNSTTDFAALTDRLTGVGARRAFSLCLYGPPGTGKSAYVRHLADRMGMEILQKRTSDLLSPWVGETESRIARAFEEARSAGAMLVFDEADSLLSDRRGAVRSWEVTQVNEMLARMESHDLPFACTTNLFERLDQASLRRFTFKIELCFLTPTQAAAAFHLFFALDPPASLSSLSTLTPGDFTAVARRADLLALPRDPAVLAAMLAEECAIKKRPLRPIGFGTTEPNSARGVGLSTIES